MSFSEKDSCKLRLLIFLQCETCIAFLGRSIVNNEKYIPTNIEYGKSRGKLVFGNTRGERK